jgi:hypothetical protein
MADTALPQSRRASAAVTLPRVGDLRPYIALALLTILALTAAYAVRPVVRIDMGGDKDVAFLRNFNGREIDAAGPGTAYTWALGDDALTVPGGYKGDVIVVLRARDGLPPNTLRQAAVAVNDIRIDMPRRPPDAIIAKVPPELAAAEQLTFTLVSPLTGDPPPPPDLVGAIEVAPARTYRWSSDESQIVLPNIGRGAWVVDMGVITAHPTGAPLNAEVLANGRQLLQLPESAEPRRVRMLVPAGFMRDGSLELTLRSNVYTDPRPLGVLVSSVIIGPADGGGPAGAIPPFGGMALALVVVLGAYASLRLAARDLMPTQRRVAPQVWVVLGAAGLALFGAWALGAYRFPTSFMLPRLAWLAIASLLLILLTRPLSVWLFRVAGVPLDDKVGRAFLSGLLLLTLVSFWLKAGGALYPYFVAIDVQWHMDRSRWIIDGQLPLLYGTNSPLNETTMPTAEWGSNRPVIPYSPWFHMIATLYNFSPLGMEMTANMVSILQDSTRCILIALIMRKAGLSMRAALIATATYAVIPVAFLLHSWGNVPTSFGLWLTLLVHTMIFVFWDRLHERIPMLVLSLLLFATFLVYTVTGVFTGFFLIFFTAIVWLNGLRGGEWAAQRNPLGALWVAAGAAMVMALIVYYGQYIPPIIERTIPYMATVMTQGPQSVGVERPPFDAYMWSFVPHLDYRIWPGDYLFYGIAIPMLFTIPGFIALRNRPLLWMLFAAWLTVAVLFLLAGYRISMVDKQLFYMLPVMCICWAVCADWIWQRGWWGRLFVLGVLALSLITALDQWVMRIATSPVIR